MKKRSQRFEVSRALIRAVRPRRIWLQACPREGECARQRHNRPRWRHQDPRRDYGRPRPKVAERG